jgi:hypothetical protein
MVVLGCTQELSCVFFCLNLWASNNIQIAIYMPVLLLRVNHYGTLINRVPAMTSMTLSHLVDGRNQISRSAGIINTFSVDFTNSLISPNDTRQTNYVVIQMMFFISFTQNTNALILLQSVCGVFTMHNWFLMQSALIST